MISVLSAVAEIERENILVQTMEGRKQWNEDKINAAVEEVIRKLVRNPKFEEEIRKHIGNSIDTDELDREHTGLQEKLKQVIGAKNKLNLPLKKWRLGYII